MSYVVKFINIKQIKYSKYYHFLLLTPLVVFFLLLIHAVDDNDSLSSSLAVKALRNEPLFVPPLKSFPSEYC